MQTEWQADTLFVGGEITLSALSADDYRRYCADLDAHRPVQIDFGRVGRADSVCLSLLAAAKRRFPEVIFRCVPQSVASLAELYEIEHWI